MIALVRVLVPVVMVIVVVVYFVAVSVIVHAAMVCEAANDAKLEATIRPIANIVRATLILLFTSCATSFPPLGMPQLPELQ